MVVVAGDRSLKDFQAACDLTCLLCCIVQVRLGEGAAAQARVLADLPGNSMAYLLNMCLVQASVDAREGPTSQGTGANSDE